MATSKCAECGKKMQPVPDVTCHACRRPFCRDHASYSRGQWLCLDCLYGAAKASWKAQIAEEGTTPSARVTP